jgi:hypothetical protein
MLSIIKSIYFVEYSDQATGWTVRGSSPVKGKKFFSYPQGPDRLWNQPSVLFNGCWDYPGVKRPGREVHHSSPSKTEVKEWSYTSTPIIGLHDVDRDKFILHLFTISLHIVSNSLFTYPTVW